MVRRFYTGRNRNKNVSDDAQITIDYIAGVSIFLVSVAFVFQFMYGMFNPFQSASDEITLAADRTSTVLVERIINADRSGTLNVIDQGKLYRFNNTQLNYSNQTAYNNTLYEIGLFSREIYFKLNVSVTDTNIPPNVLNLSGPVLPSDLDIAQTNRLVLIIDPSTGYNKTAILSVRVW